jgi:hypothetical protein
MVERLFFDLLMVQVLSILLMVTITKQLMMLLLMIY